MRIREMYVYAQRLRFSLHNAHYYTAVGLIA